MYLRQSETLPYHRLSPYWGVADRERALAQPTNQLNTASTLSHVQQIAEELAIAERSVAATLALLDDGNTVPFIARYRKEVTGGLDEEQIRAIESRAAYLRHLDDRKATVLKSIEEQGKLTPELAAQIQRAITLQQVEDLYLPYKPKRRTRATIARERGLQPLADQIRAQRVTEEAAESIAAAFLSDEVPTVEDALAGARDIVAEEIAEDATVRGAVRRLFEAQGILRVSLADAAKDPQRKYEMYYDYAEPVRQIPPHRLLAVNRGAREGVLRVKVEVAFDAALTAITQHIAPDPRSPFAEQLRLAIVDGYRRLLAPAIEREIRHALTEAADAHAIQIFSANLRHLLLQPPLRGKRVLGIDPGLRTGCKVALVDATGKVLDSTTIYPHAPQKRWAEAKETLKKLIVQGPADVVAIGNGTASRETEALVAEVIAELGDAHPVAYAIVDESGASVYSASPLARQELPDLDVSMRGAVSIARRLQDPLAELVKIDPRSIGVGQYQHDVDQKALSRALDQVVESVVNHVGVDVNTASPALLRYVAGLTTRTAEAIVAYRDAHGPFHERSELLKVKGLGPKAFQQAAGFLRIRDGKEPLDNTAVHPESYPATRRLFAYMGVTGHEPDLPARVKAFRETLKKEGTSLEELAGLLEVGAPTLGDILDELQRPGRDPRDDLPPPILRRDVLTMDDLREGMWLKGTVRNVVDFGAFVDIGVKQDGLVHISEMADRYIRHPMDVVSVGDVVEVRVLKVDRERGRIALSMKREG